DFINLFVKKAETRYWKFFYYQYAWMHRRMEIKSHGFEKLDVEKVKAYIEQMLTYAIELKEDEKILESYFFKALISFKLEEQPLEIIKKIEKIAKDKQNRKFILISQVLLDLQKSSTPLNDEKAKPIFYNILKVGKYNDWGIIQELLNLLFSKVQSIENLLSVNLEEYGELSDILVFIEILSSKRERIDSSFMISFLFKLKDHIKKIKSKFAFISNKWRFAFVKTNKILFQLLKEEEKLETSISKEDKDKILHNLLNYCEWIEDLDCLISITAEKVEELLKKAEYAKAERYYNWIEQYLLWNWEYYQIEKNRKKIEKIQELYLKLQNQHYF
ncbi:MAG: hypothetical protein ACTSPI_05180, partial [Candidatus Heimdallarchaeaceae archaeon]